MQNPLMASCHPLILLCAGALILSSCAQEETVNTSGVPDGDMSADMLPDLDSSMDVEDLQPPADLTSMTDMPDLVDISDLDDTDMADLADLGDATDISDMEPVEPSYTLCPLGQRAPWGECFEDHLLAFGQLDAGESAERLARIDNDGELEIIVSDAQFSQAEYMITWRTYTQDQPAVSTEQQLPYTLAPGESLFAVVSLEGGLAMAQLPPTQLEIYIDTGEQDRETLSLELTASYRGCAIGLMSCDMNTSNGCEVNITTDVLHCGGCNMPCMLDNATPQCAGSNCLVMACDDGFGNCDDSHQTGCETDIYSNLQHCGGCNISCDYDNADTTCAMGTCQFDGCQGTFADCDQDLASNGCESDTSSDLTHCGGCDMPCDYANATETCDQGSCTFGQCEANYYDLNQQQADGCEYFCEKTSDVDLPDPLHIDANCDGVDGDISQAIFVSKNGQDTNAGGMNDPVLTINRALDLATTTSGLSQVIVDIGNYEEQIFLANGVHIAGGYDSALGWSRSINNTSRVFWRQAMSKRIIAMSGTNINTETIVSELTIEAESSSSSETSVYALHCSSCTALKLYNNTFIAGDAGDGINGTSGINGASNTSSGNGKTGLNGSCSSNPTNTGGAGGTSACGRHGGAGGEGGSEGDNPGFRGISGAGGTPGGAGGSGGDPGRKGSNGTSGADGGNGAHGSGGIGASTSGGYWSGLNGATGVPGTHGNGGGGGGGGGGQGCFFCDNGAGNGGGGGGAGGCLGTGGQGGTAGGSSFAAFLYQSTGITLENNSFSAGNGGAGGNGGHGGQGSAGRPGGLGATACTQDVGAGGNGGTGGTGGDGGHGGGGQGGYSYAIWREQTTKGLPGNNILTFGLGGQGGASSGNNGGTGLAGTYH